MSIHVRRLVDVSIAVAANFPARAGFGTLLFLTAETGVLAAPELTRTYNDIDSVTDDWAQSSEVVKAATAFFGQTPRPSVFKVGYCPGGSTSGTGTGTSTGTPFTGDGLHDPATQQLPAVVAGLPPQSLSETLVNFQNPDFDQFQFKIKISGGGFQTVSIAESDYDANTYVSWEDLAAFFTTASASQITGGAIEFVWSGDRMVIQPDNDQSVETIEIKGIGSGWEEVAQAFGFVTSANDVNASGTVEIAGGIATTSVLVGAPLADPLFTTGITDSIVFYIDGVAVTESLNIPAGTDVQAAAQLVADLIGGVGVFDGQAFRITRQNLTGVEGSGAGVTLGLGFAEGATIVLPVGSGLSPTLPGDAGAIYPFIPSNENPNGTLSGNTLTSSPTSDSNNWAIVDTDHVIGSGTTVATFEGDAMSGLYGVGIHPEGLAIAVDAVDQGEIVMYSDRRLRDENSFFYTPSPLDPIDPSSVVQAVVEASSTSRVLKFLVDGVQVGSDIALDLTTDYVFHYRARGTAVVGLLNITDETPTEPEPTTSVTLAQCLSDINDFDDDWYGLVLSKEFRSDEAQVIEIADWVEARTKVFGYTSNNADLLDSTVTDDIATQLKDKNLRRTMTTYSSSVDEYPSASILARAFTVNFNQPNSTLTLMFKQGPGITVEKLSGSSRNVLDSKCANAFNRVGQKDIYDNSKMADGGFFDEVHGIDWLQNAIETQVCGFLLSRVTKVPYTDKGVAAIEQQVKFVLDEAVRNGLIAPGTTLEGDYLNTGYRITTIPVAEINQSDVDGRHYPGLSFIVLGAGAIHSVQINGIFER